MQQAVSFLPDLVAEWRDCHGAFYRVREEDLRWNLHAQDWLIYSSSLVAGVPVLWAEASETGRAAGVSYKTLWVSLWGRVSTENARPFLAALDALVSSRGKTRLYFGGEDFHLLPGPPAASSGPLLAELAGRGGKFAEAVDYAGSLRSPEVFAYLENRGEWKLAAVEGEAARDELGAFLLREFPGRWEREFRFWRGRPDTGRAHWCALRGADGAIGGFARASLRGNESGGWRPGALRLPLAADGEERPTDACIGPIGVAASLRGKGAGKALLALTIQYLLERGAVDACIDWTDAYGYYQPLGLSVVRSYRSAWKDY